MDFETRSKVNLKQVGLYVYADNPSTEVLCLAYAFDDEPVQLWHSERPGHPALPLPTELLLALSDPANVVEAHNANFERVIYRSKLVPHGWPSIHDSAWRCSAAKAAAHNLPRSLDMASGAMGLPLKKDKEGHKLMLKMCKPRTPTKNDPAIWREKPEDFARLFDYCRRDVVVERMLSERLRDLSPLEQEVFQEDMQMNERGIAIDRPAIHKALNVISAMTDKLNAELEQITKGELTKASQRKRLLDWLIDMGVEISDTTGISTLAAIEIEKADPNPSPIIIRVLEICRAVNRTSTAKYRAMNYRSCSTDDRLRGTLLYHGAGTGRWSGAGIQPHNFPRGTTEDLHMEKAWDSIMRTDETGLEMLYGDVMELMSSTLRGAMIAPPGHDLIVGDYSSVEARVLAWHAYDKKALKLFRNHGDPYIDLAKDIYDIAYAEVTKAQRMIGKQAELGLGFGMGWRKFKDTCKKYGIEITEEFSKEVVEIYRTKHKAIADWWVACNTAAMDAIKNPGKIFYANRVKYVVKGQFLWCALPSGRNLAYYRPKIEPRETPWKEMRPTITYMGMHALTNQWVRMSSYGGKLVENIVQATARDLMAEAILRCRGTVYALLLSVHDELIAQVLEGQGSVKEFETIMSILPDWAKGCPVTAEGWRGKRYKK